MPDGFSVQHLHLVTSFIRPVGQPDLWERRIGAHDSGERASSVLRGPATKRNRGKLVSALWIMNTDGSHKKQLTAARLATLKRSPTHPQVLKPLSRKTEVPYRVHLPARRQIFCGAASPGVDGEIWREPSRL